MLSYDEIETLCQARGILKALEERTYSTESHGYGRLAACASVAENAIFMVLNIGRVYCDIETTDSQMHNRGYDHAA